MRPSGEEKWGEFESDIKKPVHKTGPLLTIRPKQSNDSRTGYNLKNLLGNCGLASLVVIQCQRLS